jgi:host factor-I protein
MTGRTLTARPKAKSSAADAEPVEMAAEQSITAPETVAAKPAPAAAKSPSASAKASKSAPASVEVAPAVAAPAAPASAGKSQSLQDQFLNLLRKHKTPVTMFLVKGVKLQGIVTWFDNFSILLRRDGQSQLVYKHAISTIMPSQPIDARQFLSAGDGHKKLRLLQDVFLASVRNAGVHVTMFLVNGVMLQGRVAAYDLFCLLLERDGYVQMAYKHAVSTIQPLTPIDLNGEWDGEEDSAA